MKTENRFLFNFAVSYSGGGHKRLYEYAKWFNGNGGAWFVVHPSCEYLVTEFPNNRCFVVSQTRWQRLFNDCGYLGAIKQELGQPDLYYSYGIPIYARFGKVNWFHLSNVLPLAPKNVPITLYDRLKLCYLGRRIRKNFSNADVISAESKYSLGVIGNEHGNKLFLSVNGGDDELAQIASNTVSAKGDFATVVGTYKYKAVDHAVLVFEMLKKARPRLKLRVIGSEATLPATLRRREDVLVLGLLKRSEVVDFLRESKYYISMTYIENSYNAASEGIFLADESYVSDIGPHQELLESTKFRKMEVPGIDRMMLHVKRDEVLGRTLKAWNDVISEMILRFEESNARTR
jgi:glycosyltransferase involved in cell wall biosynthesis